MDISPYGHTIVVPIVHFTDVMYYGYLTLWPHHSGTDCTFYRCYVLRISRLMATLWWYGLFTLLMLCITDISPYGHAVVAWIAHFTDVMYYGYLT